MPRKFEPEKALEVISPRYGTAYRIGGRLILTAAHLFSEDFICKVRARHSFGSSEAKVVWIDQRTDIALIELPETIEPCDAVVFGRLPKGKAGETLKFQMYGYPKWARTTRTEGSTAAGGRQVEGIIYLADRSPDGYIVLEPERLPSESISGQSEWEGNSGAAIVCNGLVIAVHKQHQNPKRSASLEASPLSVVYEDEQWRKLLQKHGINPEPEDEEQYHLNLFGIPHNIPKSDAKRFVGREEELQRLYQLLQGNNVVAITGKGGIGKTELAKQYAWKNLENYIGGCCWLNAQRQGIDLNTQLVDFGLVHFPNFAPPRGLSITGQIQYCWRYWPSGEVLLVFDNVEDWTEVKPYIPLQGSAFKVLITTRQKTPNIPSLELGVLNEDEALELLTHLWGKEQVKANLDISKMLCQIVNTPIGLYMTVSAISLSSGE